MSSGGFGQSFRGRLALGILELVVRWPSRQSFRGRMALGVLNLVVRRPFRQSFSGRMALGILDMLLRSSMILIQRFRVIKRRLSNGIILAWKCQLSCFGSKIFLV
uniref:Uncharacterized protein n=1 Tax=Cacopsylla melanoneura TaxID=428564 RepID=A0A8D8VLN9_9HEMI